MADQFTWGPDNVATLITTTLEKRDKKEIRDAIFNEIPTFEYLNRKCRKEITGATNIVTPLMTGANSAKGFYGKFGVLSTAAQEGFTSASYLWKNAYVSITVDGTDVAKNQGEHQIFNLVDAKLNQARLSMRDLFNDKLYASSVATNEMNTLVTLIDATSTIGDINSTSVTPWQSTVVTGGVFATTGVANWRNLMNSLRIKKSNIDMIMTTQTIHEAYEGTLLPGVRYNNLESGNAKFGDLMFGPAAVRLDADCTSGVSYFLNSDIIHLYVNTYNDFRMDTWVKPPEQNARVTQIFTDLQVGTSNRRGLGKVTTQS